MTLKPLLAAAALAVALPSLANAHATLEQQTAKVGTTYKAVMRIGHGCDGTATRKVTIQVPEGVISVKPMPKAGWSLDVETGAYGTAYEYYGRTLTEGVKTVTWTGRLEDGHYDEFVFRARLSDQLSADTVIYFPTVQICDTGSNDWIEVPTEGQDPHELKRPAPSLKLIKGTGHDH